MPGRRSNGEGGKPLWLAATSRWRANYTGADGKRRSVYSTIPGPKGAAECRAKRDAGLLEASAGTVPTPARLTLATWLDEWVTTWVEDSDHDPRTVANYRTNIRQHIAPVIGPRPLAKVSVDDVKRMLNAVGAKGRSGTTQQLVFDTLNNALKRAVKSGRLRTNPCALVDRPKRDTTRVDPWTPDQAATFLASVEGDRLEALWGLCLMLGLRRGEALGLRWADVNWKANTVSVAGQLDRFTRTRKDRKGHAEPIVHTMPARVRNLLADRVMAQRRERVQAGAKWTGNLADLVFTTRYGTPLPANYTTEAWTARVARAGLPHRKLHDARHFAASTYFASGARMEDVAKYLGHADGSTVTRLYVHLADQVNAGAAAAMDALFPARPVPVDASGAGRP